MARYYGQYDSIRLRGNLLVEEDTTFTGAVTLTGALTQTGAVALASTLGVAGATTLSDTLAISKTQGTSALPTVDVQSIFSSASGFHVGAQFYGDLTGVGTGSVYALRGHADNSATQHPTQTPSQYLAGVHGRVINSGEWDNSNAIIAGVFAQVLNGGIYTKVSMLNCLWADWQNTVTVSAGTKNMLYITNNSTQAVDNAFYFKGGGIGGSISNFAYFDACGINDGMIRYQNLHESHSGTYRNIRIQIDGVRYWLIASTCD